jgi:murein DD-endopeptidase MepM/ murein hydrolase activator NlpD
VRHFLRIGGWAGLSAALLILGAGQVSGHERLPITAVVVGARVSQPFGCTALVLEPAAGWCPGGHFHSGVDLAAPMGTPVHAASSGTARVGFDPDGAGLYVAVYTDQDVRVLYCHLSAIDVRDRDGVSVGEVIGSLGATGLATGAHLHFEVQRAGRAVDPAAWLRP